MGFSEQDFYFMRIALEQAMEGFDRDEVPIGALVVSKDGVILGKGFNSPISSNDPTAHAEVNAIRDAAKFEKNYRLTGATMYVTLEPCLMCYGAMVHARIERLVFGAYDKRSGLTSHLELIERLNLNHSIKIEGGLLENECGELLSRFFELKRQMKKQSK
ncbi:tRNA(adenine34) deaminase [Thermotomaculum hydrothermale]|uniref:tRNA-specific adenosine deaminase n=1 Tax=Thermotomaculum hydrothermale TaxID=981385 RepID=A0A7R6SXR1_9BACT|nr:tRNA adenosine(34) deaminase TadA [Thermotomaculum hydrothermale]BBB32069.1 tRNA(adenine34) deaminase [Thermotomaculum hydrothermale]